MSLRPHHQWECPLSSRPGCNRGQLRLRSCPPRRHSPLRHCNALRTLRGCMQSLRHPLRGSYSKNHTSHIRRNQNYRRGNHALVPDHSRALRHFGTLAIPVISPRYSLIAGSWKLPLILSHLELVILVTALETAESMCHLYWKIRLLIWGCPVLVRLKKGKNNVPVEPQHSATINLGFSVQLKH